MIVIVFALIQFKGSNIILQEFHSELTAAESFQYMCKHILGSVNLLSLLSFMTYWFIKFYEKLYKIGYIQFQMS